MTRMRHFSTFLVTALAAAAFPDPAKAYQVVTVSDGGTIKGKVVYQGDVPAKKIIPTKDQETCGEVREEPEIVVGADKGVKDAVVYLKGVQKGKALQKPAKKPEIVNHDVQLRAPRPGVPGRHGGGREFRSGHAQHARVPGEGDRVQRRPAGEGPAGREAAHQAGDHARRVRHPRLDARVGLRGGQSVLRGDPARTARSPSRTCRRAPTRSSRGRSSPARRRCRSR